MKITWEAADIVPGQRVGCDKRDEQWMIGYLPSAESKQGYAVISLSDGLIAKIGDAQTIANHFNSSGDEPLELIQRPRRAR